MRGKALSLLILGIAFILSVPAISHTNLQTWISLAAASVAFSAMAWNQFLATRPKYLESLYGGLDRIYAHHRTLGIAALILILAHENIEPSFKGLTLTSGLNNLAEDVGELAFNGFLILLIFSLVKRIPFTNWEIPYQIWRQSHRLMGILFIMVAFHQFFIKRPFDGNAMLAIYLNLLGAIGIVSFFYTQIAPFLRKRSYRVESVDRQAGATVVRAKPDGPEITSRPGQFAFIKSGAPGLGESHPFTIAGRSQDGEVTFAIKPLGDFTKRLQEKIAPGDTLQVEGGYGRFSADSKADRQFWLAGGIGITPFLALAEAIDKENGSNICLVHSVRSREEAVGYEALCEKARAVQSFEYILHVSEEGGRLTAELLSELTEFEFDGALMLFCGPPPLRKAIVGGLKQKGKKFSGVKFEKFEFR